MDNDSTIFSNCPWKITLGRKVFNNRDYPIEKHPISFSWTSPRSSKCQIYRDEFVKLGLKLKMGQNEYELKYWPDMIAFWPFWLFRLLWWPLSGTLGWNRSKTGLDRTPHHLLRCRAGLEKQIVRRTIKIRNSHDLATPQKTESLRTSGLGCHWLQKC